MRKIVSIVLFIILSIYSISSKIETFDLNDNRYINVEIKGNVEENKVLKLPLGSNIQDALKQVKLLNDSDLTSLSYMQILHNNQIIVVKKKEEVKKTSINAANINELSNLPGIGIVIAERIVEYRKTIGSFIELEDLKNVKGIGDSKYEKIKDYIAL